MPTIREQDVSSDVQVNDDGKETIFVVGLGMVGCAFIEKMLDRDEDKKYRLITASEEPYHPYNRVGLTEYFEHRTADKLFLQPPEWFANHSPDQFSYYLEEQITAVDTKDKIVTTSKGRRVKYDHCVFSTGSAATYPPYLSNEEAEQTDGIFVYRSIGDLEMILNYGEKEHVKHAVVVGGGLLGLEAAKAVYDMPAIPDVSIINRQAYPLSRQLDADAGELVLRKIEALGVKVLTNMGVKSITTRQEGDRKVFSGFELSDGSLLEADLVIFAIGIRSRDEIASASGIACHESRGGIIVNDDLETDAKDVYAIGECCNWRGNTYGLIAPGVEMADILSFNFTQTKTAAGTFKPRKMNPPDLSTKLKLMGVDVASFGDFFADRDADEKRRKESNRRDGKKGSDSDDSGVMIADKEKPSAEAKRRKFDRSAVNHDRGPVMSLTYKDPFDSIYKKYIFSSDGKHLLGGMMVGDVADFVKLVAIVKKKKPLDVPPSQFIMGQKKPGESDGADLDDDTQICSCHNVIKGAIGQCIKDGITTIPDIKSKTKVGTGCGGCMPLVTSIYNAEMKKSGLEVSKNLCPHFAMPRGDLFKVIKVKGIKSWEGVMEQISTDKDSVGCEICKPAIASILSTLFSEHIMNPGLHGAQETNDRFLGNIQRDGSYSVVPRVAGGEILPDHLIVIGEIARDYGLYTKITGGQRIDMFGAQKEDLPDIWERLIKAGMESGQAYGKSLRTVKSCVGTTWCRYGVGDSVGLAVQLENRYKGIRSPHKFKGGVSGCVRECAEAQSKDFGLIAGDKGWNVFVGGNGGANPVHAKLLATDVPPSKVVTILDRYLMLYMQTADKLMRTARWLESFEGGVERLRRIIIDDELGICADLDAGIQQIIAGYEDEWTRVVNEPERRKQFKKFANASRTLPEAERITERGQKRPADWAKSFGAQKFNVEDFATPKDQWQWRPLAKMADLNPSDPNQTSVAVRYGDTQLAIFRVPKRGLFASQQMCPHKRAFVLDHGLIGDNGKGGDPYVSCPMHKRNFALKSGDCLNDEEYKIMTFDVKHDEATDDILLLLPEIEDMDAVLGTSKWMVTQASSEALGRGSSGKLEIVGPDGEGAREDKVPEGGKASQAGCSSEGAAKLAW